MKTLRVTVIQFDIIWENPIANINKLNSIISTIDNTDIIVLPEMFSTGFTTRLQTSIIESNKNTLKWMHLISKEKNIAICGTILHFESNKLYNRFYFIEPSGMQHYYDKKHLFSMADEHLVYESGTKKIIFAYKGFQICPVICYDIRFPAWCRNSYNSENEEFAYDILLCCANWPESRIYHWRSLLIARAIENQAYVVGVNRTGRDMNDIDYNGNSIIIDASGKIVFDAGISEEVQTVVVDKEDLSAIRTNFPFAKDWDSIALH
jgi:omega-amidase